MPQKGEIWRHYKSLTQMYEIVGVGVHTETEEVLVIYKPLYELEFLTQNQADFCCRPLSMWNNHIEKDEYSGPRFIKIS